MRICVFGAGALGSALGACLSRANEVTLVGRRPHVKAIREYGLQLMGDIRGRFVLSSYTDVSGVSPPDLVLLTVKAYDTKMAISQLRSWVRDDTMVLTLQNGLGNLELLREWRGMDAFGGTTTMGATLVSPGRVRVAGLGVTAIGSEENPEASLHIVRAFSESGVPVVHSHDINSEMWAKVIVSSCINPLTAILRVPNGRLLESDVMRGLMREVCKEGEQVANVMGIGLPAPGMYTRSVAIARNTSRNSSSMLQDVIRGRRTEVTEINGALHDLATSHGLDAPLNATLAAMVQSVRGEKG